MFDHTHYVPILKGKMGERGALEVIDPAVKSSLTPLIEIPPIPWDHENDTEAKTVDDHVAGAAAQLATCWGSTDRFFLDFNLLPPGAVMASGSHPAETVLNDARTEGLQVVPVTGLAREQDYQDAIGAAVAQDGRGACIRLESEDYDDPVALQTELDTLLAHLQVGPGEVDLVIDLGAIGRGPVQPLVLGISGMLPATPHLAQWRSLTVASTGFPQDMSGFAGGQISATTRTEWQVWSALVARVTSLPRMPTFGDYAINHPELIDIDPRLMQPSAAIRYTAADEWLVVKGRSLRRHKFTQFHQLSATLIARPEYSGAAFSWGDNYINDCAQQAVGVGSQTTWRKVGTSHHLAFVVSQIASQTATSGGPAPTP